MSRVRHAIASAAYSRQLGGTVEIGDADTVMLLEDFKGLLQEWLAFIS